MADSSLQGSQSDPHMFRTSLSKTITTLSQLTTRRCISVVGVKDVNKLKELPSLVPIDATWYMPNVPNDGFEEYRNERFSSDTVFFDIDAIKDPQSPYPHMLPSAEDFDKSVSELGIKNNDTLLIYDKQGIFSACRAAWMFEVFGHDSSKINILNTYPVYKESISDAVDTDAVDYPSPLNPTEYRHSTYDKSKVISYEELLELVKAGRVGTEYTVLDARSNGRFTGESPEPRPGLSSGHIPGSINLPFTDLLQSIREGYLSEQRLQIYLKSRGITDERPFIVLCGTGVTACIVKTGLELAGFGSKGLQVYDGSWTEWAQRAPAEFIKKI